MVNLEPCLDRQEGSLQPGPGCCGLLCLLHCLQHTGPPHNMATTPATVLVCTTVPHERTCQVCSYVSPAADRPDAAYHVGSLQPRCLQCHLPTAHRDRAWGAGVQSASQGSCLAVQGSRGCLGMAPSQMFSCGSGFA